MKRKKNWLRKKKKRVMCVRFVFVLCSSVMSTNKTWHRHSLVPHIFLGSSLLPLVFFLPFAIGVFPSFSIYHRRVGDRENKSFHTPHAAPFLICWRCDAATATAAAMCEHGQCKYRKWGWSALRQCSTVYISETMGRETTHTKREHIHYFT